MTKKISIILLSWVVMNSSVFGQNDSLFGLLRTSNPAEVYLGNLNLNAGTFSQVSPNSITSSYSISGAALDPNSGTYYLLGTGGLLSIDLNSGSVLSQVPITNPIAPSYFDNWRFNTSDSSLYGLARRFIQGGSPGQGYGELFLSTIDPNTGVITQISPQSVGESYALQGNAIDPHLMVYYYSVASQFIGLDMYSGLVYSSPNITFPQGGVYFDNFTYNCSDTSIYGLIRMNTTVPLTVHFGKINPQTGVVTQISQQALAYSLFSINGSSTIDPSTGTYYYVSVLPQGGNAVIGVSIQTGTVISVNTIPTNGNVQTYFDMMRHPSDCFGAKAYRLDPNGNNETAGLTHPEMPQLTVYPNPFSNQLRIKSSLIVDTYILKDAQGKILLKSNPVAAEFQLETGSYSSGIYFLEIQTAIGREMIKLIK